MSSNSITESEFCNSLDLQNNVDFSQTIRWDYKLIPMWLIEKYSDSLVGRPIKFFYDKRDGTSNSLTIRKGWFQKIETEKSLMWVEVPKAKRPKSFRSDRVLYFFLGY